MRSYQSRGNSYPRYIEFNEPISNSSTEYVPNNSSRTKIIPAPPIPKDYVAYRKEDSLKKLVEDEESDYESAQFREFLKKRDSQAQIKSSLPSESYSTTKADDKPWYLKKPSVRVGDPILLQSNRGNWIKAKVAAIKNDRIGISQMIPSWRSWRRNYASTILYYDFDSPFWKYDGKRLVRDPKDVGRADSERQRAEEYRNRYSYSYTPFSQSAAPPAPVEHEPKFKVRFQEPVVHYNPDTGRYVYNWGGPRVDDQKEPHRKEKIILAPEKHESHKRHNFFKTRSMANESSSTDDNFAKSRSDAKLERDRKRGEMIEQRIFCHLDPKQLQEFKQGKLKLNDLPALRPLLFDIEVDLDKQNIFYPGSEDENDVNEVIMNEPIDEKHLEELNKEFFAKIGSDPDADGNGIIYADDGHSNEYDDELSRFDIRGSQNSYEMNVPSLSSSSSVELDLDAFHIRPANDDFSLDQFDNRNHYYNEYSAFGVKKYNDELTLEAFNTVLGEENDSNLKLSKVQSIPPVKETYYETQKTYYEEEPEPITIKHTVVKTVDLKLDYFIDVLDTRNGQIRCEIGPKSVELCDYEDIVKGPERM